MSARTLRLLVSLVGVLLFFIYVASVQISADLPVHAPDEGLPGGPVAGLTKRQYDRFKRCESTFLKVFDPASGLGPLYNEQSCSRCHEGGGGSGKKFLAATWVARPVVPLGSPETSSPGTERPGDDRTDRGANRTALPKPGAGRTVGGGSGRAGAAETKVDSAASALERLTARDLDYLISRGGPILAKRSIAEQFNDRLKLPAGCSVPPVAHPPAEAKLVSTRLPVQLSGAGLLDAVPDRLIEWHAEMQKRKPGGPEGKPAKVENGLVSWPQIGRFGSRCQTKTLYEMVAGELGLHLGVSNPLFPASLSVDGPGKLPKCIKSRVPSDPNDDGALVQRLAFYVALLAPPPRGPIDETVERGQVVFHELGCAECHVSELRTAEKVYLVDPEGAPPGIRDLPGSPGVFELADEEGPATVEIRALEDQPVAAYTDLLLHEMGPGLADGMAWGTATGGQWRTAPLWGLRSRNLYLHDGRANSLEGAILWHGGESAESVAAFKALSWRDRQALLAFLQSL